MGTRSESSSDKQQQDSSAKQKLRVLYDFEYETRGKRVKIVKDERLLLVRKTNDDWWQVIRGSDLAGSFFVPEQATFYVPTGYVIEQEPRSVEATTRFYVDDLKMFNKASDAPARSKHSSDSFKNKVIRKLSNSSSSDASASNGRAAGANQSSTFGMCFGRNAQEAQLNPFQEELEHALSSRLSSQRKLSKPRQQPMADRASPDDSSSKANANWMICQQRLRKTELSVSDDATLATIDDSKQQPEVVVKPKSVASSPQPLVGSHDSLDFINDKRKMWAIETLMSELMQARLEQSGQQKPKDPHTDTDGSRVSGAKQLAQELHDMSESRRFENAEIQVNLLDDGRPSSLLTARSPKLLDQYNEANILNCPREDQTAAYSSVSLRLRRANAKPSPLRQQPQQQQQQQQQSSKTDFCDEMQLSPSLEKLASEIKFLPAASWKCSEADCPHTTTISQDSLRLYKRRSKSEPQLLQQQQQCRRKYSTQHENQRYSLRVQQQQPQQQQQQQQQQQPPLPSIKQHYQHPHNSGSKYKLQRKSKSLGDLDCSEMLDEKEQLELRRRYKPVPKLRSKDSFKSVRQLDSSAVKPVPTKRRLQQHVDIERSTAVGFKSLLRASDSGSEEFLQSKPLQASASNDNLSNYSRSLSSETILSSASASSVSARDNQLDNLVELPPGWKRIYDTNAKRPCYVNDKGDRWFSSNDAEGKIYFFEENSNESSWTLPCVAQTISNDDWPQLFDGNMCILKEGLVNKTKITSENGRKLRKAWSLSYAVLTELFLLFFKDAKTFAAMKMDQFAAAKPDITVDLNGAFIEPADKLSNRKNVYIISTLLGLQVLVQSDNAVTITEWYKEINDAIRKLPFSQEYRGSTT